MEDMKTEGSMVLPIVAKARERFFYGLAGLSGGLFFVIFLVDLRYASITPDNIGMGSETSIHPHNHGLLLLRPSMALSSWPHYPRSGSNSGYHLPLLLDFNHLVPRTDPWLRLSSQQYPIQSVVGTLVFCPMAFVLDKKAQTRTCLLLLVTNIVFLLFYAGFKAPIQPVVLQPAEIQQKMVIVVLILTTSLAIKMGFHTVFYDVHDDVVSANERIAANTKEKDDFFTTITHEIRNPLQSLLLSVDLLQERMEVGTFGQLLEICKNCSELILNLVSNILDMSKIGAEKMTLSPSLVDLRETIKKIMRISQGRAAAKSISLRLIDHNNLPPALSLDPQRLNQIILNIVSNAIKFTNKGEVVIKLQWLPIRDRDPDSDPSQVPAVIQKALSSSSWEETLAFAEPDNDELTARLGKYERDVLPSCHRRPTIHNSQVSMETPPPSRRKEKLGVVKIEIMDTGIGITKEGRARLFPLFFAHLPFVLC